MSNQGDFLTYFTNPLVSFEKHAWEIITPILAQKFWETLVTFSFSFLSENLLQGNKNSKKVGGNILYMVMIAIIRYFSSYCISEN